MGGNLWEHNILVTGNFSMLAFSESHVTYEISRLGMAMGHLGLLLLAIRLGLFVRVQRVLAAVGQMALSNYVAQTLICVTLFYGFGFGLFNRLERHELFYPVAAIWAAELVWSPIWLRHFRYGPLEWLWRSLTYWQRQPLRR